MVVQVTTAFFALSSSSRSIEGIRYAIGIPAHWHVKITSMPFFAKLQFPLIYLSAADEISIWVNADHVKRNSIRAHLRCNYYNIFLAPARFAALSLNRKLQALSKRMKLACSYLWRVYVRCRSRQSYGKLTLSWGLLLECRNA